MTVAVTGGTGFLGRYIVRRLVESGSTCRCWHRPNSDLGGFDGLDAGIDWIPGSLGDAEATRRLLDGADAIVHSALDHPGGGFRGGEGNLDDFLERNLMGTLRLIESARSLGVRRFVYISTCAVHDVILDDRPLDEAHPLWPKTTYGAHKAAVEAFISAFGRGEGYPICSLRPTGIYGLARPGLSSKWASLVAKIARGEDVSCVRGGKEVHAADVARAVEILLHADDIAGQAYACYDRYISELEVATIAHRLCQSGSTIGGEPIRPKNEIDASKLKSLGMIFGGEALLETTVRELLEASSRG